MKKLLIIFYKLAKVTVTLFKTGYAHAVGSTGATAGAMNCDGQISAEVVGKRTALKILKFDCVGHVK